VRRAAAAYGLESHDKPASPCLASRIPYGSEITVEKLKMVEEGEALLRGLGFPELRVRHHGDVARIEVPLADLARLAAPGMRERVVEGLRELGFIHVAVDLAGLRSGSLNAALRKGAADEPGA
jgi:pyridinium-3,5-biscarboxylic acid mononucleotide sulfurtransferase